MRKNISVGKRIGDFIAGKGFYIVLFVCTAVIGLSAWALFFTNDGQYGTDVDNLNDVVTPVFVPTPEYRQDTFALASPKPSATPKPEPTETPAALPEASPTAAPTPTPTPVPSPTATPTSTPKTADNSENSDTAKSLDEVTFIKPVAGDLIKPFSIDDLLYSRTLGDWRVHNGIDLAGAVGLKVVAATDGTVTRIDNDDMLGTIVVIDSGFGLETYYCNLAAEPVVRVGDVVTQGAVIGAIGETALGESGDVSHLHIEMKIDGEFVNPSDYLPV